MSQAEFAVSPPGLRGLNRLAIKLNTMVVQGAIRDWHLGRWRDASQTHHGILFDSVQDAAAARHSLARADHV